jgi:hypothetical protein
MKKNIDRNINRQRLQRLKMAIATPAGARTTGKVGRGGKGSRISSMAEADTRGQRI